MSARLTISNSDVQDVELSVIFPRESSSPVLNLTLRPTQTATAISRLSYNGAHLVQVRVNNYKFSGSPQTRTFYIPSNTITILTFGENSQVTFTFSQSIAI